MPRRAFAVVAFFVFGALALAILSIRPHPYDDVGDGAGMPMIRDDPRYELCGGVGRAVIAAFPLEHGSEFAQSFPRAGAVPWPTESEAPAFVVIFDGQWDGASRGRLASVGPTRGPLAAHHHDLCAWLGDAESGTSSILADVDTAKMTPPDLRSSGAPLTVLEPAASFGPVAGICGGPIYGLLATFSIGIDTPIPRCGQVYPNQRLDIKNETSWILTVTFHGLTRVLKPGEKTTFDETFGSAWAPGLHDLQTSLYGPEIILVE